MIILILVIFRIDSIYAEEISQAESLVKRFTKYIPNQNYRDAIQTYVALIFGENAYNSNIAVASGNAGLGEHFLEKLKSSSCFRGSFDHFESELNFIDRSIHFPTNRVLKRPSLLDKAGADGPYHEVSQGQIWELALSSVPNRDPNLAIRVLAFSGHDDLHRRKSSLFLNEALGEGVMLDQEMINRVERQQAPNMGGGGLSHLKTITLLHQLT